MAAHKICCCSIQDPKNVCKVTLENDGMLKYVPDCYKNPRICNKAVDNYAHVLEFVPDCYKT